MKKQVKNRKLTISPRNANQLTNSLMNIFNDVREKKLDEKTAISLTRVADTTIRNLKNQITYNKNMGKKRKITFLE